MKRAIETYFPHSNIAISCAYPETTEKMTGIKSSPPLLSLYGRRQLWKVPLFLLGLSLFPNSKWFERLFPAIADYKGSDIIVCSGGGFLNDNYHPAILGRLLSLYAAHKLKKSYFYLFSIYRSI